MGNQDGQSVPSTTMLSKMSGGAQRLAVLRLQLPPSQIRTMLPFKPCSTATSDLQDCPFLDSGRWKRMQ